MTKRDDVERLQSLVARPPPYTRKINRAAHWFDSMRNRRREQGKGGVPLCYTKKTRPKGGGGLTDCLKKETEDAGSGSAGYLYQRRKTPKRLARR